MNFILGILTGIIAIVALIEWRTGIFRDLVKLRDWNPFKKYQSGTQKKKEDD